MTAPGFVVGPLCALVLTGYMQKHGRAEPLPARFLVACEGGDVALVFFFEAATPT